MLAQNPPLFDRRLLPTKKNEVFKAVKEARLDPSQFRWLDTISGHLKGVPISELRHISTGFFFQFDRHYVGTYQNRYESDHVRFAPGEHTMTLSTDTSYGKSVDHYLAEWLKNLKKQLEAPDLWAQIAVAQKGFELERIEPDEDTGFTAKEQAFIRTQIESIKQLMTSEVRDASLLPTLASQLDFLVTSSHSQPRREWGLLLLGTLFSIFVSGAFSPQQAKDMYNSAVAAFSILFQQVMLLPKLP